MSDSNDYVALATCVAALLGLLGSVAASIIAFRSGRESLQMIQRNRTEDLALKQLNQLYGPIQLLRAESVELWKTLPPGGGTPGANNWRLIDHIEEISNEQPERRRQVVERILAINDQISGLMFNNAGLVADLPAPATFAVFLVHAQLLRQLWMQKKNANKNEAEYKVFPHKLDEDIQRGIDTLKERLARAGYGLSETPHQSKVP